MSIETYTIKAVRCDVQIDELCKAENGLGYEGDPGQTVAQVRAAAFEAGWRRPRASLSRHQKDACPACVRQLKEMGI